MFFFPIFRRETAMLDLDWGAPDIAAATLSIGIGLGQ